MSPGQSCQSGPRAALARHPTNSESSGILPNGPQFAVRSRYSLVGLSLIAAALAAVLAGCGRSGASGAGGAAPSMDAATQRDAAVYAAIVRYELTSFDASPTATPIYVQTGLVSATVVTSRPIIPSLPAFARGLTPSPRPALSITPAGLLPADAQTALRAALAPAAVQFVASESVVPSTYGEGHVLFVALGTVPAVGDHVEVYVLAGDLPWVTGHSGSLALALSDQTWTVTGTAGPQQTTLGDCG